MNLDRLPRRLSTATAILVAAVTIAVTAFLVHGLLTADNVGGPRIGVTHIHAVYQVWVCGELQPHFPFWEGGVTTEGDGVIHIHPFRASEEGKGSRLVKFFEYGGGKLTQDEMVLPGSGKWFHNGDACPDGPSGVLRVNVNGESLVDWSEYIPNDYDKIIISFGPREITGRSECQPGAECPARLPWSLQASIERNKEAYHWSCTISF